MWVLPHVPQGPARLPGLASLAAAAGSGPREQSPARVGVPCCPADVSPPLPSWGGCPPALTPHLPPSPGVYVCAKCGHELFASRAKYEHSSPWPAFTETIHQDSVSKRKDRPGALKVPMLKPLGSSPKPSP